MLSNVEIWFLSPDFRSNSNTTLNSLHWRVQQFQGHESTRNTNLHNSTIFKGRPNMCDVTCLKQQSLFQLCWMVLNSFVWDRIRPRLSTNLQPCLMLVDGRRTSEPWIVIRLGPHSESSLKAWGGEEGNYWALKRLPLCFQRWKVNSFCPMIHSEPNSSHTSPFLQKTLTSFNLFTYLHSTYSKRDPSWFHSKYHCY